MIGELLLSVSILLLIAYLFDVSSAFTKIPSVILLLILGYLVNLGLDFFHLAKPELTQVLPVIGTVGLILIVFDGSLELELNKSKWKVILKSMLMALALMFISCVVIIYIFNVYQPDSLQKLLINALPFCIISSAIAIPSSTSLSKSDREFIVYESSLSDILGVMFFNFLVQNETIQGPEVLNFAGQFFLILVLSFISVAGLSFLISRLKHHVTYAPILLLVILFYSISKVYHLPGLLFILIFGLFLGNFDELKTFQWVRKLNPDKMNAEIMKFKHITAEITFVVRALFFIIFGYTIQLAELMDPKAFPIAVIITLVVLVIRVLTLLILKLPVNPLLFYAPKGLITVLLFLSIPASQKMFLVNNALILQVILLSVFILILGNVFFIKKGPPVGLEPIGEQRN